MTAPEGMGVKKASLSCSEGAARPPIPSISVTALMLSYMISLNSEPNLCPSRVEKLYRCVHMCVNVLGSQNTLTHINNLYMEEREGKGRRRKERKREKRVIPLAEKAVFL